MAQEKLGFVCATRWEVAEGCLQWQRAFPTRRWETLPSASSSRHWHNADLTASAWHTCHVERAILDESMLELPQQPPAPLLSLRFQ